MVVSMIAQPANGTKRPMRKLLWACRETTPTIHGMEALPSAAMANINPNTSKDARACLLIGPFSSQMNQPLELSLMINAPQPGDINSPVIPGEQRRKPL